MVADQKLKVHVVFKVPNYLLPAISDLVNHEGAQNQKVVLRAVTYQEKAKEKDPTIMV